MKKFMIVIKRKYHYFIAGIYAELSKVKFLNKDLMIEKGREHLEIWKCC